MSLTQMQELPDNTDGDYFEARDEDFPWALMVMDYVKGVRLFDLATNKQDRSFQVIVASRIATTLVAMSSLRPPYGTKPGPGDGDLMTCPVWGRDDFDAPKAFDTVDELEKYINEQAEVGEFNITSRHKAVNAIKADSFVQLGHATRHDDSGLL